MRNPTLVSNHSGSIETCENLQRAAKWVRRRLTWTTLQMQAGLGVCSARDVVRHLKVNGMNISPAQFDHTTDSGRRVFRYNLL